MPSDLALMETQAATLFQYDAAGRLVCTNEPDGTRAPRLFLGRTPAGNLWRFRDDLPVEVVHALDALLAAEPIADDLRRPPACFDALREVLQAHEPVVVTWLGPAWRFPNLIAPPTGVVTLAPGDRAPLCDNFPWLVAELAYCQPCFAVVHDGAAVSICRCVRLSPTAAEAGVETIEAFRGRGYAAAVAAAWAIAVRESGRIPLYSTSWDNVASQRVARRLGLILYGADCSIT